MSNAPRFYCNNCGHLNYIQTGTHIEKDLKQGSPPVTLHCEECCFLQRELPSSVVGAVKKNVKWEGQDFADECEWKRCERRGSDSFPPPGPRRGPAEGHAAWFI